MNLVLNIHENARASLIDVTPSRKKNYLYFYLSNIPKQERDNVRYVCIDMYQPYKQVIEVFRKDRNTLGILFIASRNTLMKTFKSHWSKKHLKWLRDLKMSELLKTILEEYLISYDYYSLRIEQKDIKIEEFAKEEKYSESVK